MEQYSLSKYFAKKKFFKLFGNELKIYDESQDRLLFFVKQKAFKLKEDITVYADESQSKELLKINARSIIDFSAAYDVTDLTTGAKVGGLRRKGFKSILRDQWEIFNQVDVVIGKIIEDSMLKAVIRRFLSNLVPQSFNILVNEKPVGLLKQTFNPFLPQYRVDFSMDTGNKLDRRLGMASVILLQCIEGKQQ